MSEPKQKAFCRDYDRLSAAVEDLLTALDEYETAIETYGGSGLLPDKFGYSTLAQFVLQVDSEEDGDDAGPTPPYAGRQRYAMIVDRAEENDDHPFGVGPRSDDMYSESAIFLRSDEAFEDKASLAWFFTRLYEFRDSLISGDGVEAINAAREKLDAAAVELGSAMAETMRKWKESAGKKSRRFGV